MNIPGASYVAEERREGHSRERGPRISITPQFLAALIALLMGSGAVGGLTWKSEKIESKRSDDDHDSIVAMSVELRTVKEDVRQIKADLADTNKLLRRVVYGPRADRSVEVP